MSGFIDEKVLVRMAEVSDLEPIQRFLSTEWNLNRDYFEQFHLIDGQLLFVVGYGENSNEIYGVCGLIPTHKSESLKPSYQLALLLVKKNRNKFSAVSLLDFIKNLDLQSITCCGVRPKVVAIYEWMGFTTGKMNHYYKLNDRFEDYNIAVINQKKSISSRNGEKHLKIVNDVSELEKFDFERYKDMTPYKDFWCIKHRYFDEKKHKYNVYKIVDEVGKCDSIIVMRPVYFEDGAICKIVDFVGVDCDIAEIAYEIEDMMYQNNYEYVDFYSVGISEEIMRESGFILCDDDTNIIPHYTEPVLKLNKDIYYITDKTENFHIYIGDSDQDRSNYGYVISE